MDEALLLGESEIENKTEALPYPRISCPTFSEIVFSLQTDNKQMNM